MEKDALLEILARGEDSRHQFKQNMTSADAMAAELIAFSNTEGGQLFLGVDDTGEVRGLEKTDIMRLNQLLSNAASQNVHPPVNPTSANVDTDRGLVMVVSVEEGLNKPYVDSQGRIWVKSGADKRSVTAREEMQRLFQSAGLIYADEMPVRTAAVSDLNMEALERYFSRRYGSVLGKAGMPLPQLLQNLNLLRDGVPNLTGLMLFGKTPRHSGRLSRSRRSLFPVRNFTITGISTAKKLAGRWRSSMAGEWPSSGATFATYRAARASTVPACWKSRRQCSKNCS